MYKQLCAWFILTYFNYLNAILDVIGIKESDYNGNFILNLKSSN